MSENTTESDGARPSGGDDQPTLEQANVEHSRIDRLMLWLPEPPGINLGFSTLVWIALGVSHGAWLLRYDIFPADYVIWGAIVVAAAAGVMQRV